MSADRVLESTTISMEEPGRHAESKIQCGQDLAFMAEMIPRCLGVKILELRMALESFMRVHHRFLLKPPVNPVPSLEAKLGESEGRRSILNRSVQVNALPGPTDAPP
jgi:hypothetical protein